jgi:hypothetical protein
MIFPMDGRSLTDVFRPLPYCTTVQYSRGSSAAVPLKYHELSAVLVFDGPLQKRLVLILLLDLNGKELQDIFRCCSCEAIFTSLAGGSSFLPPVSAVVLSGMSAVSRLFQWTIFMD